MDIPILSWLPYHFGYLKVFKQHKVLFKFLGLWLETIHNLYPVDYFIDLMIIGRQINPIIFLFKLLYSILKKYHSFNL
jgi:hypothetical protein